MSSSEENGGKGERMGKVIIGKGKGSETCMYVA